MKKLLILSFLFINSFIIYSQTPTIQWQKSLGGTGVENATSIQQTIDGGYIVAGGSNSLDGDIISNQGQNDYMILKLDNLGAIQWQKSYGGTGNEVAYSIKQTTDSGYIVAGGSNSNNGNVTSNHGTSFDFWIIKLDNLGVIQWQKSLGGTGDEQASCIEQTSDNGFIIAGTSNSTDGDVTGNHSGPSDYWIVKLNNSGAIQWQKCLGGTSADYPSSIRQTFDGGYIVAGTSYSINGDITGSLGQDDCWIVKLDSLGAIQWQKSYGGTGSDGAQSIHQTTDGGYIFAGYSSLNDGDVTGNHGWSDYWVVKLDNSGVIQWQKSIGGTGGERATCSQQSIDGGYIVSGASNSIDGDVTGNHGQNDYWIVKLDDLGVIQWQKSLGGTNMESAYSMQQTNDGGYIVTGNSKSNDIDVTGNHGLYDCWIVKLNPAVGIEENNSTNSNIIYPNPSNGKFYINNLDKENQIEVYDLIGHLVLIAIAKNNNYIIDLSNKSNGIYLYKIIGNKFYSGKLIKQEI